MSALNPYSHTSALKFIQIFILRCFGFLSGNISLKSLASDELQIFVLVSISISSALVGVFVIYRKMTMIANALSHTTLFGIAITYLVLKGSTSAFSTTLSLPVLFLAAIFTGILTTTLISIIRRISRLQKDAAIGLVFTTLFAAGVLLISLYSRNAHIGVELVLGNVDALHFQDLLGAVSLLALNLVMILIFFKGLKITTFDPTFAQLRGYSISFYQFLVIIQLSLTAIGAFRAVGVVLVLSFLLVPPLLSKLFAKTLISQMVYACAFSVSSSFLGVVLSRHLLTTYDVALSTGGLTVMTLYAMYFLTWGGLALKKRLLTIQKAKQQQQELTELGSN